MIKERAYQLADALESGKYIQGTGFLSPTEDTRCCLGVACELAIEADVSVLKTQYNELFSNYPIIRYNNERGVLPKVVREWLGSQDGNGGLYNKDGSCYKHANGHTSLARMNDKGITFPEIAQVLREHWDKL